MRSIRIMKTYKSQILSFIMGVIELLSIVFLFASVGEEYGILYCYAYSIYIFFFSLFVIRIPESISEIILEYQKLGYLKNKKKVLSLGRMYSILLGFLLFVLVFSLSSALSKMLFGSINSSIPISNFSLVIRMMGTALLISPLLNVYRGYFKGHHLEYDILISKLIERSSYFLILVFMGFSYFHLDLLKSVFVSVLGISVSQVLSFIYLVYKKKKNKLKFEEKIRSVNEPIIYPKTILKRIVLSLFSSISVVTFFAFYNVVDLFILIKKLIEMNYSVIDATHIFSMLSVWAMIFNFLLISFTLKIISILDFETIDKKVIQQKVTFLFNRAVFLLTPFTLFISFLAKPIWMLFYGESMYGSSVLSYYVLVGFVLSLYIMIVTVLEKMKLYKHMIISMGIGLLLKILLNRSLLVSFYRMGLPAYYGAITASVLGYFASFLYCLLVFHLKYRVSFEMIVKNCMNIMFGAVLMIFALFLFRLFIPISSSIRFINLFIILFYVFIGMVVYVLYASFVKLIDKVFGKSLCRKNNH